MPSRASTPTFTEGSKEGHRVREPYPAWTQEANIPLSKEEIEDVLIDLANKFGFQKGKPIASHGVDADAQTRPETCTTSS